MDKSTKINIWYVIAALLGLLAVHSLYNRSTKLTPIPYSRFQALLDEDKVAEIAITQNQIRGTAPVWLLTPRTSLGTAASGRPAHRSVGCIMKDAATPKLANSPEPAKSEQALQQVQADQTSLSGLQAQQSQTGLLGRPTAPGRKPLFRS
jgi:hypothetical protein